jgi:phosphoribosylaminoimidazolecarboxamide formyltransferase/IMP cyclohydrolase
MIPKREVVDMSQIKEVKRCLISVYNKEGLDVLIHALKENEVEIISTGSTADVIEALGANVQRVEDLTGFPELLDGRVKTLHPNVHAGILADMRQELHQNQLDQQSIEPFDLVVVNLYPFSETVQSGARFDECIEKIDIGGPSMIRGAGKNFANVAVVVQKEDYQTVAKQISEKGGFTFEERQDLARKAFEHTATYDIQIANWFNQQNNSEDRSSSTQWVGKSWTKAQDLRYGENSHQKAALYIDNLFMHQSLLANAKQLGGAEMSYNNYVDLDSAYRSVQAFELPAVAIIKHANPCGIAVAAEVGEAYQKAFDCDPVSAYGSVVAANSKVTLAMAEKIKPIFTEAIIAPDYDNDALELLLTKKKMRILKIAKSNLQKSSEIKEIQGGILLQEKDVFQSSGDLIENWQLVSGQKASEAVLEDLNFAWRAVRSVKSNAILLAKNGASVGIGMGQVNRLDSCALAVERANSLANGENRSSGSVAASDAFFPFADGLKSLIDAGVTAVIQPGGSIRDEEVIEAAKAANVTMYFTGTRHFFH